MPVQSMSPRYNNPKINAETLLIASRSSGRPYLITGAKLVLGKLLKYRQRCLLNLIECLIARWSTVAEDLTVPILHQADN
jgi:hypothetical protein